MKSIKWLLAVAVGLFGAVEAGAEEYCGMAELPAQTPAARVSKKQFTLADVDKRIAKELCDLNKDFSRRRMELRRQAAQDLIDEQLLLAKAHTEEGAQALIMAQMNAVPQPTEKQLREIYAQYQSQMGGRSYEEMAADLRDFWVHREQDKALNALIEKLRSEFDNELLLPVERLPFESSGPSQGPEKAPVTIVMFADYQCPYCARAESVMNALKAKYPNKIRFVFEDYPLDFHPLALPAAILARCAGEQGQYWAMHDQLFSYDGKLTEEKLSESVKKLKLDEEKLLKCTSNPALEQKMYEERVKAQKIGIDGTPAFLINGQLVVGAEPEETFSAIIDAELKRK